MNPLANLSARLRPITPPLVAQVAWQTWARLRAPTEIDELQRYQPPFSPRAGRGEFIYPRLVPGGVLLFDDYGYITCPGARQAVDAYFADKPEFPLVLPTGQALVVRLPH